MRHGAETFHTEMLSRQVVNAEGDAPRGLAVDASPRPRPNEADISDDWERDSDMANPGSDRSTRRRLLRRSGLCVEESRSCGGHTAPLGTRLQEMMGKIMQKTCVNSASAIKSTDQHQIHNTYTIMETIL